MTAAPPMPIRHSNDDCPNRLSAMDTFLLMIAAFIMGCLLMHNAGPPVPRLIGHNCVNAGGDIWAMEEDEFPTECEQIEANL